ncbi:Sugar transporter STL1 [Talaromyces islandicus]|uniref:Sugar transporter STL1 n=1 Tax=Talaromyces islandicus TaxID=28573 RepID=A0A0U1LUN7_TALIS|nr:Sugar transporter STL1 [Talaromyces islandicus]
MYAEASSHNSPEPSQTDLQGHYIGPASGVSFLHRIQRRLHQAISFSPASSIFTFGDAPLQLAEFDPSFCMMLPRPDAQRLVDRYFDFAMPTYRFLHRPTIQEWFDEFYDTLGTMRDVPKAPAKIALLFMVFAHARVYMPEDDRPGPPDLSTRYFLAADHQLTKEKGSIRLTSVQARLTQCYYLLTQSRINHCWSLFGTVSHLALAIGLNRNISPNSANRLSIVEAECRRRTFWCAYTLDAYLSAALGRPRTFHDDDIDTGLPACIEDEDLTTGEMNMPVVSSRGPSTMLAALAHMKLAKVIGKILSNLYSIKPISATRRMSAVEEISRDLRNWRAELARFLDVDKFSTSFLIPLFQRQRNVLNLTYWHAVILSHRPFVLGSLARLSQRNKGGVRYEDARTEDTLKECLDAAMNTVNTINEITENRQFYRAFWVTTYFGFNATIMLYIYVIQECASPSDVYSSYLSAATRCQAHISAIAEKGSLSERYCLVLEELRVEALRQTKSTNPGGMTAGMSKWQKIFVILTPRQLTAPTFESQFHLDSAMEGTVTSLFVVGAFLGCLISALINGRLGRKTIAHFGAIGVTIGAVLQAASYGVAQLLVGRIVAGIGLGLVVSNIIMWQTEISPSHMRGRLVAFSLTFLILGDLIALWLEYGIADRASSYAWRLPLALQAALALLLNALLFVMPESPRWLLQNEYREEAIDILTRLNTHRGQLDEDAMTRTITDITDAIAIEHNQAGWVDLFKGDNVGSRRRVVVSCILNACQAWSGSTPVSYYTTIIFRNSIGLSYKKALLLAGILQVFRMCASVGTWYSIEKWGRRLSFMVTALGMTIVMAVMAAMIAVNTQTAGIVAAVMLFLYEAFYAWGFMGPIWVYAPEILPLAHRAKGEGLATACLWLSTFVVVEIVPVAITNIGWRVYLIFACFNLAFIPFIYFFVPETAGLSLESIDLCFMDRAHNPVKKANEMRRRIKEGRDVTLNNALEGEKNVGSEHVEKWERILEKKLTRRIDVLIMPLIILVYLMNYIDRNNYAAAKLQGLIQELSLTDQQYQTGLSILFIAYILMQVPSNLLLNYMGRPSLYISFFVCAWGLVSTCTSQVQSYGGIVACRFLLGLVEAPFFAGVLFYLSKWYTKKELAFRMSVFYSGSLLSGAFGNLIAAGILNGLDGKRGMSAWRWLYIIEGSITCLIGIVIAILLPDFPETWRVLSPEMKVVAIRRLAIDAAEADIDEEGSASQLKGLKMAVTDVKTYALALAYFCIAAGGSFQYFFPTLTSTLGYSNTISLLLVAPPYVFMVFYSLAHNWISDKIGMRFWFFFYPIPITIIGFIIFMTTDSFGPRYFSLFLMNFTFAQNGTLYSWIASSLPRPPAKRAAAYAFINSLGNSASIWTPYTYYDAEKPYYRVALGVCIAVQALGGLSAIFMYFTLHALNKRQERLENEDVQLTEKEMRRLQRTADLEGIDVAAARQLHKGFRYML